MSTKKRGRVLRYTSTGEGLVFVEGRQYRFKLEGMWSSEFAPQIGMVVDAEFDDTGVLQALGVVGDSIPASAALEVGGVAARKMFDELTTKGWPVLVEWARRIGYPTLIAWALLVVAWFWLPVVSMELGFAKSSISFYDSLLLMNDGSRGLLGLMTWVSLLAVFLPQLWKDSRANYGLMLPLALMALVGLIAFLKASPDTSHVSGLVNTPELEQMVSQMRSQMWNAVSFGFGFYLSLPVCAYFAFRGWLSSRRTVASVPAAGTAKTAG